MCGICGIVHAGRAPRAHLIADVERMRDTLSHRGPDDAGSYVADTVALGHRRLSIIDIDGGAQPMASGDGALHIVYNGEIYNHQELKRWLEQRGHVYRTRCDTETVLRLYQETGTRCVEHLRGMFAFAIWDEHNQQLFLARDRLGIKPLYYVLRPGGSLFFASEVKALFKAGAVSPEIDYAQLPDYLANHATSGPRTLYAGVTRLQPGHTLRWRNGMVDLQQYWDLSFAPPEHGDDRELTEEFLERFRTSVRIHLMSDVPLGVFLSGGIDSAAITAVASSLRDEPIKTFSVAFAEKDANELPFARMTAAAFGADHHEAIVSPAEFFSTLPALVWHEDEPMAHPSSIALHFVSRLAAQHVKVVLTGEGSDELLGGYGRYRLTLANLAWAARYERAVPTVVRRAVQSGVAALPNRLALRNRLMRSFLYLPPGLDHLYWDNFAVFSRTRQLQLLTPQILERVLPDTAYAVQRQLLHGNNAQTMLDRLLFVDLKTYLHELLMKQDQMSMSASVESRVPFLDHELVEFVARLPQRLKLRRGVTKYVLRHSMERILPPAILARPKMGFPVPFGRWIRGPYRVMLDEYLLSERVRARGIFDAHAVARIVNEHMAGMDHSERIWSLLNFEVWQRLYFDGESAALPAHGAALAAV